MKTDRELLELAAKAAGYQSWGSDCEGCPIFVVDGHPMGWNPLIDDGDALRLAVKLSLSVDIYTDHQISERYPSLRANITDVYLAARKAETAVSVKHDQDSFAATRRAITRAAAEIGEQMP